MIVASIAALLAAAQSPPQTPQADLWVAYTSTVGSGTTRPTREADGALAVSAGSGRFPIFALKLVGERSGSLVAEAASPRNFDRYELDASRVVPERYRQRPDEQAQAAHERLEIGIEHHRPSTRFEVAGDGTIRIVKSTAVRRHERCARALLRRSSDRLVATAPTEPLRGVERSRRRIYLAMAEMPRRGPSLLLRLLRLRLPPMNGTAWSEFEQRNASDRAGERSQYSWRSEQIRAAGQEVGLSIDLISDRTSPAARLCRSLQITGVGRPVRDECRVEGYIDRRDGWPIVISVTRSIEASDHSTSAAQASFSRIIPLQGFVVPPNPCAAAER